jgi:hypothetical protein
MHDYKWLRGTSRPSATDICIDITSYDPDYVYTNLGGLHRQ